MRWNGAPSNKIPRYSPIHLLHALIFIGLVFLVACICFAGQGPLGLKIVPGQVARSRLISQIPFSYESKILRKKQIEERSQKVPPSYKLNLEPFQKFRSQLLAFSQSLSEWEQLNSVEEFEKRIQSLEPFVKRINDSSSLRLQFEDVQILLQLDADTRSYMIEEGLLYLREILTNGIIDSHQLGYDTQHQSFISIQVEGQKGSPQVQSTEDAYLLLRRYLKVLEVDPEISGALFRIFKNGIHPNLIFDPSQRESKIMQLAANVPPVVIHMEPGQVLLESGQLVTVEDYECLMAYRRALQNQENYGYGFSKVLLDNLLLTFILLLAAVVHIRLSLPSLNNSKRKLGLCAFVFVFHLIFIRGLFLIGDIFLASSPMSIMTMLPYLAPIALGPMILAIMLDAGTAILLCLLVSALTVLMHNKT